MGRGLRSLGFLFSLALLSLACARGTPPPTPTPEPVQGAGPVCKRYPSPEDIPLYGDLNRFKYPNNPVLEPGEEGEWDSYEVKALTVVWDPNERRFIGWYEGRGPQGAGVGVAFSKDGLHWEKYLGNPVLMGDEEWEKQRGLSWIGDPYVVHGGPGYLLFYEGQTIEDGKRINRIGLAVSKDGIHWEKRGIILDVEPMLFNEVYGVSDPVVYADPMTGKIFLIFEGHTGAGSWAGLAISEDGGRTFVKKKVILWPFYDGGLSPRTQDSSPGGFLKLGDLYLLFIEAVASPGPSRDPSYDVGVGLAISRDLFNWQWLPRRILTRSEPYEAEIVPASVIATGDRYLMYYRYEPTGENRVVLGAVVVPTDCP